jgi:hypothetical protein
VLVSWLPKFAVVGETLICAITAFPLTAMDCGLCGALSLICTVAERLPAAVGLNVTLNAQVIFTPRLAGQLFGAVKSPGSAPLTPIDEIASGDAPEFVSVTLTGEVESPTVLVPNPTLAVESVAPSVTAVAWSGTLCGLPGALSATLSVAEKFPALDAVKVTAIVHADDGASVPPESGQPPAAPGETVKLLALPPVKDTTDKVAAAVPAFSTCTVSVTLVVPTPVGGKDMLAGTSSTLGAFMALDPLSATDAWPGDVPCDE